MHRSSAYRICATAVAVLLVSSTPVFATTRSELEAHRRAASTARAQAAQADALANQLAKEVSALDARIETLQSEATALDPKISAAQLRTAKLEREVAALRADVASTQRDIDKTQVEYTKQQGLLAARVASTYKQGEWFYIDVLLGSRDFRDLVTRSEFVERVIESNNNVAESLSKTKARLDRAKTQLDRSLKSVTIKRREAQSNQQQLVGLKAQRQARVNEQESVQNQKTDLMSDSRKNAARLRALAEQEEAESDRIAAELSGTGSGKFAGSMAWPVPASNRITSGFGFRICPFHGRELHPGIDIGRPVAAADWPETQRGIVAAGAGTVLSAGYRGGYGNTVIIDHGNGVTTLYAHQSSGGISVSAGQRVKRGDRIGTVGSTGNSTGPHLHFEVRVNGSPRNPQTYQ